MTGIGTIVGLGYMIRTISQQSRNDWFVAFSSPYEWETWHAYGTSIAEAATNAAKIAKRRGPALEASAAYRARVAARFAKGRVRLEKPKRARVRLKRIRL